MLSKLLQETLLDVRISVGLPAMDSNTGLADAETIEATAATNAATKGV